MKYLIERSLYFYFLIREVVGTAGTELWRFIAKSFSVNPKQIKAYEAALTNPTLQELSTVGDIEMYGNYIDSFFNNISTEFGKTDWEKDAINAKALALHKINELFGETRIKENRLRSLALNYELDHSASILYALQLLYLNRKDTVSIDIARDILQKELDNENSDAGLILLQLDKDKASKIAPCVKNLPDMLVRPDMIKYLTKQYGDENNEIIYRKHNIGF